MKREIKFRVWDNVDYMSQPFTLQDLQEGNVRFTPECKVMQFTGLQDKNGVDIYEGDKLMNPKGEKGTVIWYEAGFHLECKRRNSSIFYIPLTVGMLKNKTICGNIHEPINH